jgi:hypothetical protein
MDRQMDIAKLIGIFLKLLVANAPNTYSTHNRPPTCLAPSYICVSPSLPEDICALHLNNLKNRNCFKS